MSIQYERDDDREVVAITLDGVMPSLAEIRQLFHRRRADSSWHYGILYDLRRMIGRPSFDYLAALVANASPFGPRGQTRGPVVFLTGDSVLRGVASAFVEFGGTAQRTQVFETLGQAEAWLFDEMHRAFTDKRLNVFGYTEWALGPR